MPDFFPPAEFAQPPKKPKSSERAKLAGDLKKPIEVKVVTPSASEPSTLKPKKYSKLYILIFIIALGLMTFYRLYTKQFAQNVHKMKKLRCNVRKKIATCTGAQANKDKTFIVELSESCASSVYEVGGVPFSIAFRGESKNVFAVPATKFTVKNVVQPCEIRAFIDTNTNALTGKSMPFIWVTTAQNTRFTIRSDSDVYANDISASLFDFTSNGRWVAYSYDVPKDAKNVRVIGDGSDIIYTYGVLS